MMHHNGIKTNQYLTKLNLQNPYYEYCEIQVKFILHSARDCKIVKHVWQNMLNINKIFKMNLTNWLEHNMKRNLGKEEEVRKTIWSTKFHSI